MKPELPDTLPNFQQLAHQMRINCDILKAEITEHCDKEIARLDARIEKRMMENES